MKKSLLLFFAATFAISAKSQNYQSFRSDRSAMYGTPELIDKSIKVDSVKMEGTDSVFYLLKDMEVDNQGYCYSPFGPSFVGEKIIVKNSGWNLFFNANKDTIKINTLASLNQTWECFKTQKNKAIAKVTKFDTTNFLGINDSVKTMVITVYDLNNVVKATFDFKLSKNYGLIKTFNFREFPGYSYYNGGEIQGITNPQLGVKNITWRDIYDHAIGDEIHTDSYSQWVTNNVFYKKYISTKKVFINKTENGDTIKYSYAEQKHIKEVSGYSPNQTVKESYSDRDTLTTTTLKNSRMDKLPGELIFSDWNTVSKTYMAKMTWHDTNSKLKSLMAKNIDGFTDFGASDNNCWHQFIGDPEYTYSYYEGLDGEYHNTDYGDYGDYGSFQPVYFKKNGVEWGTPLDFKTNISEIKQSTVTTYPNPTTDFMIFNSNDQNYTLKIFDLAGKLIDQQNVQSTSYQYKNEGLIGVYFYEMINQEGQTSKGKIVFQ